MTEAAKATARRIVEFLMECGAPDIESAMADIHNGAPTTFKAKFERGLIAAITVPNDPKLMVLDDDQTYRSRIHAHFDESGDVADWVYKVTSLASGELLDEIGNAYWVFRDRRAKP